MDINRGKLFRAGKIWDFKNVLEGKLNAYRIAADGMDPESDALKMMGIMIRELESVIESYTWWYGWGEVEEKETKEMDINSMYPEMIRKEGEGE